MYALFRSFVMNRAVATVVFAALLSMFVLAAVVQGATTISTNIDTGGTLSVTGLATFSGGATTTTLTLLNGEVISNATDGVIQLGGIASSTSITLLNGETITNATDGTIALTGAATISSTLSVTSLATFLGGATTTTLTLLNGETITNATDGTLTLGATNVVLVGTASTSALKVGDEPAAPTINGMVFGYCSFANKAITASTTGYVDCTVESGLTGSLTTSDRVFVQATSSFDSMFVIQAASTTGVSTINLRVLNTGLDGTADGTLNGTSINFWAVR